jgi:hypothetical protein
MIVALHQANTCVGCVCTTFFGDIAGLGTIPGGGSLGFDEFESETACFRFLRGREGILRFKCLIYFWKKMTTSAKITFTFLIRGGT